MPEPTAPNTNQPTGGEGQNGGEGQSATPPVKPTSAFDPKALGDDDLKKVLEDPRIWKQGELAELREARKELKKRQEADAKAEEEKLAGEKKFQELSDKYGKERDEWKGKYNQAVTDNAILTAASKLSPQDPDAVLKLIDRSKIEYDDNGSPKAESVSQALDDLKTNKAYLFDKPRTPNIGGSANPASPNVTKVPRSQLVDPVWYAQHHKDVMSGKIQIEDDVR